MRIFPRVWKRAFKTAHSLAKEPRLTSGAPTGKIAAFLWSHANSATESPALRNQKNRASARVSSRIPSWASPTGREPAASRGAALLPRTAARQKRGMAASTEKQAHPAERCLSILRMFHRSHDQYTDIREADSKKFFRHDCSQLRSAARTMTLVGCAKGRASLFCQGIVTQRR